MAVEQADVVLVGAGTMSATLGVLLRSLDPSLNILMVESLDAPARESSDGWNNAGTGHAGYCELNYTPETKDGQIDTAKAMSINANFEISLQLWSWLVEQGHLPDPESFINPTPHLSFVWGEKNVDFLRRRHELLSKHHLFADMAFSDDPDQLREWMPLVMAGRKDGQPVAATRVPYGADVDFGALTRHLVNYLDGQDHFELRTHTRVRDMRQRDKGGWSVELEDTHTDNVYRVRTEFVFLGAGGAALPLLHKSGIPEGKGYGGFPVSGQWLVCQNQNVVAEHEAKVYGKAAVGAPPMSVPHLDTRIIGGKRSLLFGPFAGFTTKFLKSGSVTDLMRSMNVGNVKPMVGAGLDNMPLTVYLMREALQSQKGRMTSLREYYPEARDDDWELAKAGQRVQIIKQDAEKGGKLEFGTEIIVSEDGSLAALLGASPGASTAVSAMLDVIERCFPKRQKNPDWKERVGEMIPSYGRSLIDDPQLARAVRARTLAALKLRRRPK
ncbi:MAG: malate dehydrogenase (quinone) [Natronospirillum sp.]|uniref:malate dehydrogenase (quinone) n=1 Tax=Natronospirillum sp. TaxID=2812955 RepID=UPI0025FBCC5C|nr:malate dehydrogenase (quinone) [Natronospirillum sp.]MCH8553051.1 malate dehydrogenase (quinone) [Natronospirillum sp.]